jgi:hypothetical protein
MNTTPKQGPLVKHLKNVRPLITTEDPALESLVYSINYNIRYVIAV